MGYLHIDNLYKNQTVLMFKELYALEKIHGTSAHIHWTGKETRFFSGGAKNKSFVDLFNHEDLDNAFRKYIGSDISCTVYGEAYGGSVQKMRDTYGDQLRFIVFDIKIGDLWLNVPDAAELTNSLGLEFVYYTKIPATVEAVDAERDKPSVQAIRNGMGDDKLREGIVLRPLIELRQNNNERVIVKHKGKAFHERLHQPKVTPDKLEVLTEANKIANEWVTPMRLEHVLDKLPEATGIEHTGLVIRAMIEDVYREAKGEITESKEVKKAIGSAAAKLWKQKVCVIKR